MPYVMEYNRQARIPEYAEIARIIGRCVIADDVLSASVSEADHALILADSSGTNAGENREEQLAAAAPRLVQLYLSGVEIPSALSQIGFDPTTIGLAAEKGGRPPSGSATTIPFCSMLQVQNQFCKLQ
jgi:alcohol dehydrogenase class IV